MRNGDAHTGSSRGAEELVLAALDRAVNAFCGPLTPLHLTFHDTATGPPGAGSMIVAGLVLRVSPARRRGVVYVPLLARRAVTAGSKRADRAARSELVRDLILVFAARFPGRPLHVVTHERHVTRALRDLPDNVTVTARMPDNAVIHGPAPPRTGLPGRPRRHGDRLGSLPELAAAGGFAALAGANSAAEVRRLEGQWYPVFSARLVQVVLVRWPGSGAPFDLAIASSDRDADAAELLARYRSRRAGAVLRHVGARALTVIGEWSSRRAL